MALSPMDIHHKEFNTVRVGGYNKEEVDAFLDQVADELDRLLHRNQEYADMVESMRAKVAQFDSMQQTLQNAIINAQISADNIVAEAKKQAESILEQAKAEVERVREEARRSSESIIQSANAEREEMVRSFASLKSSVDEFVTSVRNLLAHTAGLLDKYEEKARTLRMEEIAPAVPEERVEVAASQVTEEAKAEPLAAISVPEVEQLPQEMPIEMESKPSETVATAGIEGISTPEGIEVGKIDVAPPTGQLPEQPIYIPPKTAEAPRWEEHLQGAPSAQEVATQQPYAPSQVPPPVVEPVHPVEPQAYAPPPPDMARKDEEKVIPPEDSSLKEIMEQKIPEPTFIKEPYEQITTSDFDRQFMMEKPEEAEEEKGPAKEETTPVTEEEKTEKHFFWE